jgi:alkylation response protein AidB-like acyl-CoA dehydrogenase
MTILTPDVSTGPDRTRVGNSGDTTLAALQRVIFGDRHSTHVRMRDAVLALKDIPESGLTYAENAARGPQLLRSAIAALGGSSSALASDPWLRSAFCSNAAVAAPRLHRIFSGHFDLATYGLLTLGNNSAYQLRLLENLETGSALGVFVHTELGGTNGMDVRTLAVVDRGTRRLRLVTPDLAAAKFMPNVAGADGVPRVVLVTARLMVDDRDEGVFAFLLRLSTAQGPVDGVEVVTLPDKAGCEMDHGLIVFNIELPWDALLGGQWARLDDGGQLTCTLNKRQRFHRTISALSCGRIDLPNAAVATARTALAMLVHYAQQRKPADGIRMADRDGVQRDFVSAAATVYTMTAFGNAVVEQMAADTDPDQPSGLWAMAAKPLLTYQAAEVLQMCRQRAGARGVLRINYLPEWISNVEGTITAEGENQIMWKTAGGLVRQVARGKSPATMDISALEVPGVPDERPWWCEMLAHRAAAIADEVKEGRDTNALGRDSAAIDLAAATTERLAADAILAAAHRVTDQRARELLCDLAAVWTLGRIQEHSLWYCARGLLTRPRAALIEQELTRRRQALVTELPLLVAAFDIPALPAPMLADDEIDVWRRFAGWGDRFPASA